MIVQFGVDYLRDLFQKGYCNDKKHRYRADVIKRYQRGINILISASRVEDLFRINSLNFEALHGNKEGLFSIRVNNQYRIEFSLKDTEEEPILTICTIVELSNHYK